MVTDMVIMYTEGVLIPRKGKGKLLLNTWSYYSENFGGFKRKAIIFAISFWRDNFKYSLFTSLW